MTNRRRQKKQKNKKKPIATELKLETSAKENATAQENKMQTFSSARLDLILGIILVLLPLGISMMGYQLNIAFGAGCWLISLLLFAHGLWIWEVFAAPNTPVKIGILGTLLLWGTIGTYFAATRADYRQRVLATTGLLKLREHLPTQKRPKMPIIEFGQGGVTMGFGGTGPLFQVLPDANLTVRLDENQEPLFSTDVRDDQGNIVATVRDNHWEVATAPTSWDKNYTEDALEVLDRRGHVVLQVRLFPDRVQFQGEWRDRNGVGRRFLYDSQQRGMIMIPVIPNQLDTEQQISPMFRYPSREHLGEFR